MSEVRLSRRIWILASLLSLVIVGLVGLLFRPPAPLGQHPAAQAKPTIELPTGGGAAFDDRAAFKDPSPLFLPTPWNSAPAEARQHEPIGTFTGYEPKYAFSVNDLKINLPPTTRVPRTAAEALVNEAPGNPIQGIGRADVRIARLDERWAFLEVVGTSDGRRAFVRSLPPPSLPPGAPALLRSGAWRPVEFVTAVDPQGLVGRISPVPRSGMEAGDPFLQLTGESLGLIENYLAETLRLGDRLPPGFYRILIGP
jgi:hypothetical protein